MPRPTVHRKRGPNRLGEGIEKLAATEFPTMDQVIDVGLEFGVRTLDEILRAEKTTVGARVQITRLFAALKRAREEAKEYDRKHGTTRLEPEQAADRERVRKAVEAELPDVADFPTDGSGEVDG